MEIFFFWLFFSIIAGVIASNKGRSGFGFFLLSVLLSPLVGIVVALVASPGETHSEQSGQPSPSTHYRCPDCKELILIGARVCKHCGCKIACEKTSVSPLKCPVCQIDIPDNKAVCSNCGIILRE